ncbi:hypothetical protein B0T22DRAFT_456004 [Podospora appendiculata]|uniref:Uncharacterized protein n=1 Tax=Podospora appendiculata TaxID=314037 RepID=A0AAE0XLL9_9PEZI|nr:hypothetical protein B0T22DRAFT_456004 [Podospora appendiculata]
MRRTASFGEWPLDDAVLKRTIVNGVATFQMEFSWDACVNHGQVGLAPEKPQRRPLGNTMSQKERKAHRMPEKGLALLADTSEASNTSNLVSGDDDNGVYGIDCLF